MDIFNNSASCFKPLDTISQIFDFDRMLGLARECGLVIRNRKIKPLLVLKAFLELGEGCRHISMSAAWRRYSFLCGLSGAPQVSAGAFIRFMGRGRFQKFLEALADEAAMKLGDKSFSDTAGAVKALSARLGGLRDIIAQDGTEVSANPQAARKAPEAFKSRDGAAAVKMHAAWSLEKSRLDASSFTSAVSSERDEIQFQELNGRLILCDAGYPSVKLLEKLSDQGVLFLLKMQSSIKPSVLKCTPFAGGRYGKAMDLGGERIKLKDDPRLGGQRSYDCVVSYARKGRAPLVLRVVKVFNPHFCGLSSSRALEGHEELAPLEGYCYLITNIPATQLHAVGRRSALRSVPPALERREAVHGLEERLRLQRWQGSRGGGRKEPAQARHGRPRAEVRARRRLQLPARRQGAVAAQGGGGLRTPRQRDD